MSRILRYCLLSAIIFIYSEASVYAHLITLRPDSPAVVSNGPYFARSDRYRQKPGDLAKALLKEPLLYRFNYFFGDNLLIDNANPRLLFTETVNNRTTYFEATPTSNSFRLIHPVNQAGGKGSALSFNGTNQYGSFSTGVTGNYSASLWFKTTDKTGAYQLLIRLTQIGNADGGQVFIKNGQLYTTQNAGGWSGNPGLAIPGALGYADGKWHHLVISRGSGIGGSLYVDNLQKLNGVSWGVAITTGYLGVAVASGVPGQYYNGMVDQLLIYNRTLNAAEVSQLYNGGYGNPSPDQTGLVRRWEMDEASGSTVASSVGGVNMTMFNLPTWDLNGQVGKQSSVTESMGFNFQDGINNGERGIMQLGDAQGGVELQGKAIRSLINGKYAYLQGLDGHIVVDPTITASVPDENGSYNPSALQKWGAGSATVGQVQYAEQSTPVTPSAQTLGAHWWSGARMNVIRTAGATETYAYMSDLTSVNAGPTFGGPEINLDPAAGKFIMGQLANTGKLLIGWNYTIGGGETDLISNRGQDGSDGGFIFYDYDNNQNMRQLMQIKGTNGYVGIGVNNPDSKLTVNGTVHAREVKVDLNFPAPDYVFLPNYKLANLKELDRFVTKNHHLPEIPSAVEIKQNGLKLGEMNALLLKKVEELTLYLIEKDKQVTTVMKMIYAQQKQLSELRNSLKSRVRIAPKKSDHGGRRPVRSNMRIDAVH